ncbi:MAG: isoprenylcysteine carboxylmethyltransferase family protein [Vicinamibacterales bacterium]
MRDGVLRTVASVALVVVFLLFETLRSRANGRALRARGAIEPTGDVYRAMFVAYPLALLAPFASAIRSGPATAPVWAAGVVLFLAAKGLKFWAIGALGPRWTFRVLVVPGEPLVTSGPYQYLRHPNYLAVAGEIVGAATMCAAPAIGAAALLGFGALMLRRIAIEERALTSSSSRWIRPRGQS